MGFGGLYISISGIYANKKALDTISHNISNVNNPNYVRQSAIHADARYSTSTNLKFQTGTGVNVQQIRQIRDEFLDGKIRRELATFGYYNTKSEILGEVESIFSSGLQSVMKDFWNGWSELSKEPDLTMRGLLHENAVAFTTTVNHISTQLDNLQYNLNKEILTKTEEVNNTLKNIADLNKKIKLSESYGQHVVANDYRDNRNALLDRLSQLVPINHYENQFGESIVSIHGKDLINGDYFNPIEIKMDENGLGHIHWSDTGAKINLKGLGELGGYIDSRDKVVVEYRQRLNILVGTIADEVNKLHRTGVDLEGINNGEDFFNFDETDPSTTIKVNPLLEDFNKIAAGGTAAKGDGDVAKAILGLREELLFGKYDPDNPDVFIEPGTVNIDGFYRDLTLSIGIEGEKAKDMAVNQILLIKQIDERRSEISSVSLDEEMADMLKYQHSYIANSRVINAIDEMIENIVNKMGIVGR